MTTLTTTTTLEYNGVTFPDNFQTVEARGTPVRDSARRTIVYWTYHFTFRAIFSADELNEDVGPDASTDVVLENLRKKLTKPGQNFVYNDAGFGMISIDTNFPPDVRWGPFPTLLSWKPIGWKRTCEVTWGVQIAVQECDAHILPARDLALEFNYRAAFNKDLAGYTTRTISGHVIVPHSREGEAKRDLNYTVDEIKEKINPRIPFWFRRIQHDWVVSEDKSRADFTITDEQMPPNIPPSGIVQVTAEQTVSNTRPSAFFQWTGRLAGSYEVAFNVGRNTALKAFSDLVRSRLNRTMETVSKNDGMVIPRTLTMSEPEIYGRRAGSFSLDYWFTVGKDDKGAGQNKSHVAVEASGLWRPLGEGNPATVAQQSYQTWFASMAAWVFHPSGHAGLNLRATDDLIVDLCFNVPLDSAVPLDSDSSIARETRGQNLPPREEEDAVAQVLVAGWRDQYKDPAKTWLDYSLTITVEPVDDNVECKLLPQSPVVYDPSRASDPSGVDGYRLPYMPAVPSLVQHRNNPSLYVTISGHAVRAGYDITPPTLQYVGGCPVIPMNRGNGEGLTKGIARGVMVPLVACRWKLRYLVVGTPTSVGLLEHPFYGSALKVEKPRLRFPVAIK